MLGTCMHHGALRSLPPAIVPASHPLNGFLRLCSHNTGSSRGPWKAPWSRLESTVGPLAQPHTSHSGIVVCPSVRGRTLAGVSPKALTHHTEGRTHPERGLVGPPAPAGSPPTRSAGTPTHMHTGPCGAVCLPQRQRKENMRPARQLHSLTPQAPRGPPEPRFPGHQSPCDTGSGPRGCPPAACSGRPAGVFVHSALGWRVPTRHLPTKCLQNAGPALGFRASRSAPRRRSAWSPLNLTFQGRSRGCGGGEAGAL